MGIKRKVPYVPQLMTTECGLCCVLMVLKYYGSHESLSDLRKRFEIGRDGLKLSQIDMLLKSYGFDTKVYKAKPGALKYINSPAILFWDNCHYVVLERCTKSYVYIVDPSMGRVKFTIGEAAEHFSKYILTASPNEQFVPKKGGGNIWLYFAKLVLAKKAKFISILLLSVITYGITLVIPMMIQYIIDGLTQTNGLKINCVFILVMSSIFVLYGVILYICGKKQIDFSIGMDTSLSQGLISHLLKLPFKFFETRSNGDIMFRIESLHIIRDLFSKQLIDFIISIGSIIFILAYMLCQSKLLSLLAILMFLLTALIIIYTRQLILEANQCEISELTKLQVVHLDIVYSIFNTKLSATENAVYDKWKAQFAKTQAKHRATQRYQNIHTTAINVIKMISPVIILIVGLSEVHSHTLTLGCVIAFYTISTTFAGISVSIFQSWDNFILSKQYLERIKDITDEEPEKEPENPVRLNIQGNIRMENVSFSYTNQSEKVLNNISIEIGEGQKVAIVGPSGSGKTTLSRIILGLYMPTEGKMYYDGIDFSVLDKKYLRKQMGIVPQDLLLNSGSILDNIKMNRSNISDEDIERVSSFAQIDNEIKRMPMKYQTLISDMGTNISGGQKQRIALARAIISNPKVIILDEATSSLDAINEEKVSRYLGSIGCTRIVIAHRLSTIVDSDKIFVMDKGRIIECGKHEDLLEAHGMYYELYKHQILKEEESSNII